MKSFKPILSILTIAIFTFMAVASGDDAEEVASSEAEFKVTAAEIVDEYESNEVAAQQKYGDKIVEITGIVDDIGLDIMDDPYITIGSGGDWEVVQVQAMLAEGVDAASVESGSEITIKGKVSSKMMNILVDGCIIK